MVIRKAHVNVEYVSDSNRNKSKLRNSSENAVYRKYIFTKMSSKLCILFKRAKFPKYVLLKSNLEYFIIFNFSFFIFHSSPSSTAP